MGVEHKIGHRRWKRMFACAVIGVVVIGKISAVGMIDAETVHAESDGKETRSESALENSLYSKSAVLMDAESGRVLFGKEADTPRPMASTTKIMTCIVALEHMQNENEIADVSENAAGQPKVHLNVKQGQQFYLKDLLYSLMLESHNDSAVIIAEHVGGSVQGFASMMNEKAAGLGCENTYFVTPNGLDASDENGIHSTTAKELAAMMKYCIMDSTESASFRKITGTKEYQFQDVSGTCSYSCYNHNAFLGMMDGAFSGKTGFTGDAGYCYVGALERDGKTLIVALLACGWPNNKGYKWSDTKLLMNYGLENFLKQYIWKDPGTLSVIVENGIPDGGILGNQSSIHAVVENPEEDWQMLLAVDESVDIQIAMNESVEAPVDRGEVIGKIVYFLNGEKIGCWNVVAADEKKERTFFWCLEKAVDMYIKINQCK